METSIQNTKAELNLHLVRLTPEIIDEINSFQTGGTHTPTDEDFNNSGLKSWFEMLFGLRDFLIMLYKTEQFDEAEIIMDHLVTIEYLKDHFMSLRAPTEKIKAIK